MSKTFSLFFKLAITAVILFFLISRIEWQQLGDSFRNTDILLYLSGLLMVLIASLFMAVRWHVLLRVQGISQPLRKIMDLTFIGLFFNTFLLGATGGDLTKLYYLNQSVPNQKTRAIVSLLMDRGIGLLVLIGMALPFFPFEASRLFQNPDTRLYAQILLFLFAAGIVGLILFFTFPVHRLPQSWRDYIANHPQLQVIITLLESIRDHGRSSKLTLFAILLSLISQMFNVFSAQLLASALGLEMTFGQCMIIVAIVFTLISLPITIGGHGLRELAFIKLFSVFGIITLAAGATPGKETAIAFSLLFFSYQLGCGLVGGIFYLLHSQTQSPPPNESAHP